MRVAGKVVGLRLAERLANLGGTSVQDLPLHIPSRYQDRTRLTSIAKLGLGGEALVQGNRDGRGAGFCRPTHSGPTLDTPGNAFAVQDKDLVGLADVDHPPVLQQHRGAAQLADQVL